MDKNSLVGLLLIGLILFGFSFLNRPSEEELEQARAQKDSIEQVIASEQRAQELEKLRKEQLASLQTQVEHDSAYIERERETLGSLYDASMGEEQFETLENDLLKITFSTLGGKPYSVELKDYTRFDGSPLVLFDGDSTSLGLEFFVNNRAIATDQFYFTSEKTGENQLKMKLSTDSASYLEYIYRISPDDYMVDFDINMVGMNQVIAQNTTALDLNWNMYVPAQEKGRENENNYTSLFFKYDGDEVDELSATKDSDQENVRSSLDWIAFKQQFFASVLLSNDGSFQNADLKSDKFEEGSFLKRYQAVIGLPYEPSVSKSTYSLSFYFGPNSYSLLKKYDNDLQRLVPLGGALSRFISKAIIIPTFNFLNRFISSYGLIILILTILIKVVLLPFTYKSYISMAKMRALKPLIDEINQKIPADKALERNHATTALYKKAGVNPLGGCLPILLQFPILIAMFRFFPSSIELRQQAFLWADDLSTYDSICNLPFNIPFYGNHVSLFTILMTITTILSTKFSSSNNDSSMPGMKMMTYMMPIMFMLILNNFSAALTYYYFLANLFTLGQNFLFKGMIDEEKFLAQVKSAKGKPVKKSKLQMKLEKMAKENEQRARR